MKIGIYCRVSTAMQAKKGISIEDQKRRGIEFCNNNNYTYEVFCDKGYSGDLPIGERPALNSLIEKIFLKEKEIDGVFVVDFDRISRNEKEALTIREILVENDIKLFESNGEVNLKDPTHILLLGIKGLLGSFERKKTIVRIKRTIETSALEGKAHGGILINYGYKKDENKKFAIHPTEEIIVKRIYELCLEGKGTKVIAEILNNEGVPTKRMNVGGAKLKVKNKEKTDFIWRDAVVYRILTNPIYKGKRLFRNKFVIDCPAIIEESVFDAVQEELKKRKNLKDTTNKHFYLLKGLLFCATCGSRFYGRKREDLSDNQYICSSQRYKNEYCGSRGINIDRLENWIWSAILKLPEDFSTALTIRTKDESIKGREMAISFIKEEITNLEIEANEIIKTFGKLSINRFTKKRLDEIEARITELEAKIIELEKQNIKSEQETEIHTFLKNYINPLKKKNTDSEKKKEVVRSIIDNIKIYWDKENLKHSIQINYRFDKFTEILLTKKIDFVYKKLGYSIRANSFDEFVRIQMRNPSSRVQEYDLESKDLFIKQEKYKKSKKKVE